jgi:hypothetical protein
MAVRLSKVEVLAMYWEKLMNSILLRATYLKDEMTKLFCNSILYVPRPVREAALTHYVNKCREVY